MLAGSYARRGATPPLATPAPTATPCPAAPRPSLLRSGSMAVLASAVDSVIDLLSQFVIWLADWAMAR